MGDTDDGYTLWYEVGKRNLVQQPWYRYMDTTTNSVSNTESRFNPAKLPELNTVNRGSLKRSREEGDLDRTSTTQARPTKRTSLDSTTSPCPPESKSSHMLSLKRQRSADDYDSVSIERAQPAKRVSLGATVSAGSVSPAPMNQCPMILSPGLLKQQERCIHKIKTGCSLSSMACCCACADKRATSSQYMVYVDGKGDVMTGKRWHWYCRGCNKFWARESARGKALEEPLSFPGSEAGIEIGIAQSLHTIKILKSTDLTVDTLKVEIARALACDVSALVLEASGINLDTIGLHQQEALRELTMISCFQRLDEACDLMDDVQWS